MAQKRSPSNAVVMTSCQAGGKQVSFSHNAESPFIIRILNLTFWDLLFFEGKNEVPSSLYDNATSTQLLKNLLFEGFHNTQNKNLRDTKAL